MTEAGPLLSVGVVAIQTLCIVTRNISVKYLERQREREREREQYRERERERETERGRKDTERKREK